MTELPRDPQTDPDSPRSAPAWAQAFLFLVAALLIGLDQLTKVMVERNLPFNHSWAPFPALASLFRFTHVTNTGAAFGLFSSGSLFFTVLALVVAGVIVVYNFRLPGNQLMLRLALGLQMGGALGNLVDRLRQGYVTDFLDFGPWPVFNLADTSIVVGAVLLALLMLQEQRQEERARREQEQEMAPVRLPAAGRDDVAEGE